MVRKNSSSCPKEGLKRGAWTSQEDELLSDYISAHGLGRWRTLPANAGLNRCGKSCRLRWLNYLRPHIKRGNITEEEEELIIRLHKLLGNRWSLIAGRLPGRTDNEIKNYWNTHIRRKLLGGCSSMSSKMNTKSTEPSSTPQVAIAEEDQAAEKPVVNVIRTKAVRCTRTLFADPLPSSDPPAEYSQLAPELRGCNNAEDTDEPWMAELVQIPQLTDDSPYTSCSDSLHNNNNVNVGVSFHEDEQYLGEWFGSEGDQGLYSLLDPDTWDTLTLTQNIHTTGEV